MRSRSMSRALALVAAPLLVLGLAACGDDDDDAAEADGTTSTEAVDEGTTTAGGGATDAGEEATVVAEGFAFEVPASVPAGSTVAFDNRDSVPHTMTADDEGFDSGRVNGGESGSVTAPAEPGAYAFHCEVHPNMTATLTVA